MALVAGVLPVAGGSRPLEFLPGEPRRIRRDSKDGGQRARTARAGLRLPRRLGRSASSATAPSSRPVLAGAGGERGALLLPGSRPDLPAGRGAAHARQRLAGPARRRAAAPSPPRG